MTNEMELLFKLEDLFTEAFELGHNIESNLDRELFAQWLILKGVTLK